MFSILFRERHQNEWNELLDTYDNITKGLRELLEVLGRQEVMTDKEFRVKVMQGSTCVLYLTNGGGFNEWSIMA